MSDYEPRSQRTRDARPRYDGDRDSAYPDSRNKARHSQYEDPASDVESKRPAAKARNRSESPDGAATKNRDQERNSNPANKQSRNKRSDHDGGDGDDPKRANRQDMEPRRPKNFDDGDDGVAGAGRRTGGSDRRPDKSFEAHARDGEGKRGPKIDLVDNDVPSGRRHRERDGDDEPEQPRRRPRERDTIDEPEAPRRRQRERDTDDDPEPVRRRDTERPRHRDEGRAPERPRRDERDADAVPRHRHHDDNDRGYRSDGRDTRRKPDDHGYRSDGRDARHRREEPSRSDRAPTRADRGDRNRDRDRDRDRNDSDRDRDRHDDRKGKKKSGFHFNTDDIGRYVEQGTKQYKNYKPLIDNLAKMYMDSKK